MRTMQEIKQELLLKEIRTTYWERNHSIPTMSDIEDLEMEVFV